MGKYDPTKRIDLREHNNLVEANKQREDYWISWKILAWLVGAALLLVIIVNGLADALSRVFG